MMNGFGYMDIKWRDRNLSGRDANSKSKKGDKDVTPNPNFGCYNTPFNWGPLSMVHTWDVWTPEKLSIFLSLFWNT